MNKRKPGATKPSPEEVAVFDAMTLHELGRLLAAGRIAYQKKQSERRAKVKVP